MNHKMDGLPKLWTLRCVRRVLKAVTSDLNRFEERLDNRLTMQRQTNPSVGWIATIISYVILLPIGALALVVLPVFLGILLAILLLIPVEWLIRSVVMKWGIMSLVIIALPAGILLGYAWNPHSPGLLAKWFIRLCCGASFSVILLAVAGFILKYLRLGDRKVAEMMIAIIILGAAAVGFWYGITLF